MLWSDLKKLLEQVPGSDNYEIVVSERFDVDQYTVRRDKPITTVAVDESSKEICIDMTESKLRCKKCNSSDVLVGNGEDPHHCSKCGHEWPADGSKKKIILGGETKTENFHKILMKEPEVLGVVANIKKKSESIRVRLDRRLSEL